MLGFWPTASCFLASFLALTSGQSLSLSPKSDNNYINVNNRGFTNVIPKTSQPSQFLLQKKQRELNSQLKPVQERAVYDFTCPDEFEGFYPHETSCDKYWVCEHGIPRLELCGNGLAFADTDHTYTTRSCEYLHHVDCGNRTQVEPPISAPNCPRLFGTFRDPNDCRVFYNCRNGLANRFECAPGLAFDTKTNVCVWADQVKSCRAMSRSGHDSADVFQCPNNVPLGIFSKHAHPEDCRLYFVCISGVAREYGCPHGTVFSLGSDEFTGKCSDPRAVPECSQYYGDQVFDEDEMAKSGLDTGKPSSDSGSGSFKIEPRSSNYIRNPRHNSPGLTIKELAELNVEINRDFSVPHVKRESPKFTAINKFHYPKPQKPSKYSPRKSQRTPTTPKQNTLAPVKQKAPATITVEEYFPKKPTPAVIVPPPTDPTTVGPPVHYSLRTGDPNGILEIVLPAPVNKKYGLKSQVFEPHTPKPLTHKTTPQTPRTSPHTPRTSPHTPKTSSNPSETSPHTPRTPSPPQKKPVLFQHSPQPKQSFPIPPIPTSRPSKHQQVVPVTIPHHDGTVDKAEEPVEVVKVKGPGDEYYYYYYYDDDEEDATEEDGGNAQEVSEVPNKN